MASTKTRAQLNRGIRQEALRDQLSAQGHVQHVVDCITKIQDVDTDMDVLKYQRLKTSAELRLKLINKYLADLKAVEVTGGLDVIHSDKPINKMTDEELRELVQSNGNVTAIR